MTEQLYRRKEVESLTGLSRSTIYKMMSEGTFPKPVHLTQKAVAWRDSDLSKWISELQEAA